MAMAESEVPADAPSARGGWGSCRRGCPAADAETADAQREAAAPEAAAPVDPAAADIPGRLEVETAHAPRPSCGAGGRSSRPRSTLRKLQRRRTGKLPPRMPRW